MSTIFIVPPADARSATRWGIDMPYRCPNCKAQYPTKAAAEMVVCPGCQVNTCGSCVVKCFCCDVAFCSGCRTREDYGEGVEQLCAACKAQNDKDLPRCTSCNQPRVDLVDGEDRDDEVGYHAKWSICGDCRALNAARDFFEMSPIQVFEISEIALETCPF